MKNDMKKRVLAGSMALVVGGAGLTGTYGCGKSAMNEVKAEDKEVETLEETAKDVLKEDDGKDTSEGKTFKEESVYIKADPSGKVTETTVTEWLKNPGKGNLSDESGLSDIKNVKGEETFTQGDENALTWKSEGEDIYYQGTTDGELPVGVKVSYKLDGKAISAKELDGKSGKVEIKIDYSNHSKKKVKVNKKEEEMYVPFTMVTAMMLSTDEYTNVEVDNGKVISDGDKNIVVGVGFPGLEENLNLDDTDLDIDIPDSVKITADVKKATVGPTVTMASAEIMDEFNLDDVDSFDDLEDSLDELEDAADKLVDGSQDAADGAKKLSDGSKELKDGTKALKDGSGELADGSKVLADGSKAVADGVGTLNSKSGELIKGVNSLAVGVAQYTSGVVALRDGSKTVYGGAQQLEKGIGLAKGSVHELGLGAKQVSDGISAMAGVTNNLKTASSLVNDVEDVKVTAEAEATAVATATVDDVKFEKSAEQIVSEISLPEDLTPEQKEKIEGEVKKAVEKAQKISAKSVTVEETAKDSETVKVGDNSDYKNAKKIVREAASTTADAGLAELAAASKQVYGGLQQLEGQLTPGGGAGNPTIADGAGSLTAGASQLYQGASALASQNDALNLGTTQLKEGGAQLAGGVKQLADGSSKVADGAKALNNGSKALNKGAEQLDDGTGTLIKGTEALADGNQELADGMSKFKKEGIDELTDVFDGDIQNVKNRLDAMSDMSKEYKSYAGIKKGMDGSTKFIIETEGIDTEE